MYVEELNDVNSDGTIKRAYQLQDIKKASAASVRVQGKSLSSLTSTANADIIVSQLFGIVKTYDKNFNPKPISKVINKDKAPKIMYRGGAEDISIFDRKKSKYTNLYGRGFYFTDDRAVAERYGTAREYYLNIKNPLSPKQNNITKEQMRKFLKAVAKNDEDYDIWNYGTEDIEEILAELWGKGDFEMIQDVSATAIGDMVAATELFNRINGTDYDGFILPTETVVFNSTQIKSATNNIGTFDGNNQDVRFSKPDSIDKNGKKEYNNKQNGVMWTAEHDTLSKKEIAQFYEKISETKSQGYSNYALSADGELIYEIGDNKLVYTDGDYDYPRITKVVEIDSGNSYYVDYAKEAIINGEKDGLGEQTIDEIIAVLLPKEAIRRTVFEDIHALTTIANRRREGSESSGADSDSRKDVRFSIDG